MHSPSRAEHHILNLGAGVQSTTLYLMYLCAEIQPQIECAIFADTGEEPDAVYRHLEWLKSLGGPPIITVSVGKLGDDLQHGRNSTGQRFASIPAYTAAREGHKLGIVRRQCTREYKIEPIERYIRSEILGLRRGQRAPSGVMVFQSYGISMDEAGRSIRIRERLADRHWITPVFPLIGRLMTRGDCYQWLQAFGVPHEVQKSACVFCPFKSNAEWRRLRDIDPAGWRRAVEIDNALRVPVNVVNRNLDQKLYVPRRPLGSREPRNSGGCRLHWT